MTTWLDDPQQRARAAADPGCPAATLQALAAGYPEVRPLIAANPAAYPALIEWLAALRDPAVDAALVSRGASAAASAPTAPAPAYVAPAGHAPAGFAPFAFAAAPPVPQRRIRPWGWWLIGGCIGVVVAMVAAGLVAVVVPAVTKATSEADSPFFGTAGATLLTPAEVRAATKKSDGIFDGDPNEYTLPQYIDAYSSDSSGSTQSSALLGAGAVAVEPVDASSTDEKSAPADCWSSVTGFLSLPALDTTSYAGYRSDRIWSIEDDTDGGTEQARQFVDQASARRYFAAEAAWYTHCAQIDEYTTTPENWDQRDVYIALQLPKMPAGVRVQGYT
ncbi:MAG: hypothetical protein FWF16_09080, partial [Microbacteriaceae bacterium]|nr:hypothetical protein [Microbacteriaceae bacterium]